MRAWLAPNRRQYRESLEAEALPVALTAWLCISSALPYGRPRRGSSPCACGGVACPAASAAAGAAISERAVLEDNKRLANSPPRYSR